MCNGDTSDTSLPRVPYRDFFKKKTLYRRVIGGGVGGVTHGKEDSGNA